MYLRDTLKLNSVYMATGVKNLHPEAHKYDVGIYCESNGHGTFLVNEEKMKVLKGLMELPEHEKPEVNEKVKLMVKLSKLLFHFSSGQN